MRTVFTGSVDDIQEFDCQAMIDFYIAPDES